MQRNAPEELSDQQLAAAMIVNPETDQDISLQRREGESDADYENRLKDRIIEQKHAASEETSQLERQLTEVRQELHDVNQKVDGIIDSASWCGQAKARLKKYSTATKLFIYVALPAAAQGMIIAHHGHKGYREGTQDLNKKFGQGDSAYAVPIATFVVSTGTIVFDVTEHAWNHLRPTTLIKRGLNALFDAKKHWRENALGAAVFAAGTLVKTSGPLLAGACVELLIDGVHNAGGRHGQQNNHTFSSGPTNENYDFFGKKIIYGAMAISFVTPVARLTSKLFVKLGETGCSKIRACFFSKQKAEVELAARVTQAAAEENVPPSAAPTMSS